MELIRDHVAGRILPRRVPPRYQTRVVDLPDCSLHVLEAGDGPPLIIVPATLSELENWRELVQFMGQFFHSYFFELPGHGGSTALLTPFSSDGVAEVIRQLVDDLGAERFNLMGFSFGGILAMKTHALLHERIDRLILLAPCLTKRAITLSQAQRLAAAEINRLLKNADARSIIQGILRSGRGSRLMAGVANLIGRVENQEALAAKLQRLPPTVLEVFSYELDEILGIEFPRPGLRWETPCYLAMSIHDPLLEFGQTVRTAREHFADLRVAELTYPFHQPPRPFTFDELNEEFGPTVQEFLLDRRGPSELET